MINRTTPFLRFVFYLVMMALIFSQTTATSQTIPGDGWNLSKNKKDILIYTRSMDNSKLKMFKLFAVIDISIEHMVDVLQDIENYHNWSVNLKHTELLEQINENDQLIYTVLKMPWPFDNRDVINRSYTYWSESRDTATLVISCLPDYLPEEEGIVRMPQAEGEWHLIKLDKNKVKIEYTFSADPGGSIPEWVVNLFIVDGPYKTINNLKDYMKTRFKEE